MNELPKGILLKGNLPGHFRNILSNEALDFIAGLQRKFNSRRENLLQKRIERQKEIDAGNLPDFLKETQHIREDKNWKVGSIPDDLQRRWVEITGPVERKMMINALNSGADVFMADCEDANSPTWENIVEGQINLGHAVDRTISFTNPDGRTYTLNDKIATLLVRPRGWHLPEKHILVDGEPMSASLVDFGLYFFHNAKKLLANGTGPYFYLAKLENHLEARLWNDVFNFAQDALGIPRGTIKATVLIENVLAAFEMEEILYELRDHISGLNAGRWDYIFSVIKKFRNQPDFCLPDRAQITMTVPFMRAYTELMVKACHQRGAHAIGGMAAFIPSRRDAEINRTALAKVAEDKRRESNDGFDGTWIAHPDLVPTARAEFEKVLGDQPHQKHQMREDVQVSAQDLMNFEITGGTITEAGLRLNVNVGILYMASWLEGVGAAAIYNLMEDAATAEISRAQLWQWVHRPNALLDDGRQIDLDLYHLLVPEEMEKIKVLVGAERFDSGKFALARQLLDELVSNETFADFLTLIAYEYLD